MEPRAGIRWGTVLLAGLVFALCGYVFGLVLASDRNAVFDSQLYRSLRRLLPLIWAVLVGCCGMLIELVRQGQQGR